MNDLCLVICHILIEIVKALRSFKCQRALVGIISVVKDEIESPLWCSSKRELSHINVPLIRPTKRLQVTKRLDVDVLRYFVTHELAEINPNLSNKTQLNESTTNLQRVRFIGGEI